MRRLFACFVVVVGLVLGGAQPGAAAAPVVAADPLYREVLAATRTCQFVATTVPSGGRERRIERHRWESVDTPSDDVAHLRVVHILRGIASAMLIRQDGSSLHLNATTCTVTDVPAPTTPGVILGRAPFADGFYQARTLPDEVALERCDLRGRCDPPRRDHIVTYQPGAHPGIAWPGGGPALHRTGDVPTPEPWSVLMGSDGRRVIINGPLKVVSYEGTKAQARFGVDLGAAPDTLSVTALPDYHVNMPARAGEQDVGSTRAVWADPRAYVSLAVSGRSGGPQGNPSYFARIVVTSNPPGGSRPPSATSAGVLGAPGSVRVPPVLRQSAPLQFPAVTYMDGAALLLSEQGQIYPQRPNVPALPGHYTSLTSDGTCAYALGRLHDGAQTLYRLVTPTTLVAIAQFRS